MGKRTFAFAFLLWLSAGASFAASSAPTTYEKCLEMHRQGLEDRHYEQSCKNKGKNCLDQYGSDYLNAAIECRKQFGSDEGKVTFPDNNDSLDCSNESKTDMQALGESCQSVGQAATSRCDPSESRRIINLAGQRSTNSMQQNGGTGCRETGQFNQEAASALQRFTASCEPAITEGDAVCSRASSIISRSSCSASQKARYQALVTQGQNSFSQHRATLNDARSSVQAAQNTQNSANKCTDQTAAAAQNGDDKKTDAAAAKQDIPEPPAATPPATEKALAPGESAAPANFAGNTGGGAALANGAESAGDGGSPSTGSNLFDLPTTKNAEPVGAGSSSAGGSGGASFGSAKLGGGDDASAGKGKKAGAAAAATTSATTGKGRSTAAGFRSMPLSKSGSADGDEEAKRRLAGSQSDGMPNMDQFRPNMGSRLSSPCSPKLVDGITGPHCEQWEKVKLRYSQLLDGSGPG